MIMSKSFKEQNIFIGGIKNIVEEFFKGLFKNMETLN